MARIPGGYPEAILIRMNRSLLTLGLLAPRVLLLGLVLHLTLRGADLPESSAPLPVGVAQLDITPGYPVRLSGFGGRRTESEGVVQRIWAKALAFPDATQGPLILITTDNLGVPDEITTEVARRLAAKVGLRRERLTITATHTHTAPMLKNVAPTLFGVPIPPEHQANIDRYTSEFIDRLEAVALQALTNVAPSRLFHGRGTAGFAANRRPQGGPVDHDLPFLVIRDGEGQVRAVYFSYACHCVTLSLNQISGDWAGYAQEGIQELYPGAIALASVGCGADADPNSGVTGGNIAVCRGQGMEIALEIQRVIEAGLTPLRSKPEARYGRVELPLDPARSREEWNDRVQRGGAVGYHASVNLARLDRGETLPTQINYPVQTWVFGDELAVVFLPGETVVDYALRLKSEFDRQRLWVNGYANDGRCYLPSERILEEGGYEGGDAMIYYDVPQRFAPGLEEKVISEVRRQIPEAFRAFPGAEGTRPFSPDEALRLFQTHPDLDVELAAAEPLIEDPVAIDWGADGRLWVCEMRDYPSGMDNNWQPGGRVKVLRDTDHDGRYDQATLFLDDIPFPTGIFVWGRGVWICSAPNLLWAEDTDGDGRADRVETVFTGFGTDNYQARINGLSLGLDNWIYGSSGLLGGVIHSLPNSILPLPPSAPEVNLRNRDFRFSPATGAFETALGVSQQGRVRDDWGEWFGCDNSSLVLHYPMAESYVRRNPQVAIPHTVRHLTAGPEANRLFPTSRLLERFNDHEYANRVTSAGGIGIYRDRWLGESYYGNAFICEAVHNLVHREILEPGLSFRSRRPAEEQDREFLSSTDHWFRPVQARTGPDGALYIVDIYRFLIEHPRWIPADRLSRIDARAGAGMGRIYRLRPQGKPLREIKDLTALKPAELAASLDTPNGTERDRVQVELLTREEATEAVPVLEQLARTADLAEVRIQALSVLEGLVGAPGTLVAVALADPEPGVRCQALRLSERFLAQPPAAELLRAVTALTNDPSPRVLRQLAFTLGETDAPEAGQALRHLATRWMAEPEIRSAVLTSATRHAGELLEGILATTDTTPGRNEWLVPLVATAAASGDRAVQAHALAGVLPAPDTAPSEVQLRILSDLLVALGEEGNDFSNLPGSNPSDRRRLESVLAYAREVATRADASESLVESALRLLGVGGTEADVQILGQHVVASDDQRRRAALEGFRRRPGTLMAVVLLERWDQAAPRARADLVSLLLERREWTRALLEAIRGGRVQAQEISIEDRQRLAGSQDTEIRTLARSLLDIPPADSRTAVIETYRAALSLTGDRERGRQIFSRTCASCHALEGTGHDVGPDLRALRAKDQAYWLQNILDPNAVVEPRFVHYDLELKDGRLVSGLIKSETPATVLVVSGNGLSETVRRSDIDHLQASNFSMMPEGLEQAMNVAEMADLLAFVATPAPAAETPSGAADLNQVLRDAPSVARLILDSRRPDAVRQTAVSANPQFAAALIQEMTRDLTPGTPEEHVRIPWIWRVSIACGRRNDSGQVKSVLDASLPQLGEALHDWQAVVIGGGIIGGISERERPRDRIAAIIGHDLELGARWNRALELASALADREDVPPGTRYDALRLMGLDSWERRGTQIRRYLSRNAHPELQQGAVSALLDMSSEPASEALLTALPDLTDSNRTLALEGFLKDADRFARLLDAIETGRLSPDLLSATWIEQALHFANPDLAERAQRLLRP